MLRKRLVGVEDVVALLEESMLNQLHHTAPEWVNL
jgi:hypothetical protein